MSIKQNRLVLMADAPEKGKVLKRLAREIGDDEALEAYKASVRSIASRYSGDSRWSFSIAVTPDRERHNPLWLPHTVFGQGRGKRGQKMMNVFINMVPGPLILVTPECPFFSEADLLQGFDFLATHDILFGADDQGSFWAVGMRREPVPIDPFKKVDWKGSEILKQTKAALRSDRKVAMLRELKTLTSREAWEEFKALNAD